MFSASRFFSSVIKKYCFFASLTPILFHLTRRVTVHLQQMEGGLNKIYMTIENLGQLVHVCRTVWNSAVYAHVFCVFFFVNWECVNPKNRLRGHPILSLYHSDHSYSQELKCICIYSKFLDRQSWANSVDPDQTPHKAASDLGLHCLTLIQKFCLNFV